MKEPCYYKHMKSRSGFTIVELLIVIVVVAILAAISVVAYNGIQQRADASSVQSSSSQIRKAIELAKIQSDSYPSSITGCPSPTDSQLCLRVPEGMTANYEVRPQGQQSSPAYSCFMASASYALTVKTNRNIIYTSPAECISGNEFLQYMDMAPIINQYGLRSYRISFDIKSANTSSASGINVYMQNGSGAKYSFSAPVTVTTSYTRRTVTVTPVVWQGDLTNSILAFYGTYNTGNIPTVKNMEITLAD